MNADTDNFNYSVPSDNTEAALGAEFHLQNNINGPSSPQQHHVPSQYQAQLGRANTTPSRSQRGARYIRHSSSTTSLHQDTTTHASSFVSFYDNVYTLTHNRKIIFHHGPENSSSNILLTFLYV